MSETKFTPHALLVEAIDLVPRVSDDDPMAPALAEWCERVKVAIAKARDCAAPKSPLSACPGIAAGYVGCDDGCGACIP